MIECSRSHKWYHRECCNVDAKYFEESEDTEWSCMSCEQYVHNICYTAWIF